MKLIIVALLAFAPLLQADTVKTKRGQSFEGIVVGFSEKTLRLNTGYGTLRFDRKSQVADVTRSLYNWPGEDDAPERTEAFEKRNDPKSAAEVAKEAKLKKFPRRHGKDEMTGAAFRDRLVAFTEFVESGTNSAKEKRKKFKATKFKYIYVTAPVQSIEVESIENDATGESEDRLRITIKAGTWYDARTGEKLDLSRSNSWNVWAVEGLNGADLDKRRTEEREAGKVDSWIDFYTAKKLKEGSLIVFKIGFSGETGEALWTNRIVRYKPPKAIRKG